MNLLRTIKRPLRWLSRSCREVSKLRITSSDRLYELFEQQTLQKLFEFLKVDCVFDVGANAGQYASMLRKRVGYRGLIISCEPIPHLATHLRSLSVNDKNWYVEEVAISSRNGTTEFNVMQSDQFSSLGTPFHADASGFESLNKVAQRISVRAETLCSLYQRMSRKYGYSNPFLKMDTQGHDVAIVCAAGPCLSKFVGLQSELAVKKLYQESVDFRDAIGIYESRGFELTAFVPNNMGHFPRLLETDCIMIRRDLWGLSSR